MKEKMFGAQGTPEEIKQAKEMMTEEESKQSRERETKVKSKIKEKKSLESLILGKKNINLSPEIQIKIACAKKISGYNDDALRRIKENLASNPNLSEEAAKILAEETKGFYTLPDLRNNLAGNLAVPLETVHQVVEGFGLYYEWQTPFEGALYDLEGPGNNRPQRKIPALDKTLVSIIKQITENQELHDRYLEEGEKYRLIGMKMEYDRAMYQADSLSLMIEENGKYIYEATRQLKSRLKEILEASPEANLPEILDISQEDFEKYVKPLLGELSEK